MMGNHGALAVGESVPKAFERLYFLERAARRRFWRSRPGAHCG